jgi:3-phosphoshikimate 1-carboxyvinyltransferase
VLLDGDDDVSEAIRTEEAGMNASRVSALPLVRTGPGDLQHNFAPARTGGRWARHGHRDLSRRSLKVFLTASAERRASDA